VILKVRLSTTCGSDLHLIGGYIPAMEAGDVLGHEFLGDVVEVGAAVRGHKVGDRMVVASFIGCGRCWYCAHDLWS
jgi:threonine dehydrogenase-like Zn-dependent dehydrogenase